MKKKWVGKKRKMFYSELWGNVVRRGVEGRENPVGLSMFDGPMETVECIWMNI